MASTLRMHKPGRAHSVHTPAVIHVTATDIITEYRLAGLVVKASASGAEDPGFESSLRRDFSGVESYQ